jgi:hypothetical protein
LDPLTRYACIQDIKNNAYVPGIKQVWTYQELQNLATQPDSFEDAIKKQLFPGRSGDIIMQTYPYAIVTDCKTGTTHETAYGYDTHVPLIIFQHGAFEDRTIRQRVSMIQFANSMAEIMNIQKPSASTADILPGLYDWEFQ